MPVIGTAGHVDHGKSTLILALTGRDPDRWEEEKRRGLTIDLGFAWMTLPDGSEVSFVDVPGHERFMKNMLAGVDGLNAALLVVAANEGWMPQTEEHLAVLNLLDINRGVVALTKVDTVDLDRVRRTEEEVAGRLEGSVLEGAAVVQVAAPTGQGLGSLVAHLSRIVDGIDIEDIGWPRLWVDRSFSVPGSGTVVTGTLTGGALSIGDRLTVWPSENECRVRSLQTHERSVESAPPGRRVAVGLVGVSRADAARGSMLAKPRQWMPTHVCLVQLRKARYVDELSEKGAYQLHVGSRADAVRLRILGDDVGLVRLDTPVCLAVGDRFVIRDVGARRVVGGGRVLDPSPQTGKRLRQAIPILSSILARSRSGQAEALLEVRGTASLASLAAQTWGGTPRRVLHGDGLAISDEFADDGLAEAERLVAQHHEVHPLDPGMATATLASHLRLPPAILSALIERSPSLQQVSHHVRLLGFAPELSEADAMAVERARAVLHSSRLTPPPVSALGLGDPLLKLLERTGQIIRVGVDLAYLPGELDELIRCVRSIDEPFTVSEFRQRAGISRRYAIPFLEWCDLQAITRREGTSRLVLPPSG